MLFICLCSLKNLVTSVGIINDRTVKAYCYVLQQKQLHLRTELRIIAVEYGAKTVVGYKKS